jgi:hypothetical protein
MELTRGGFPDVYSSVFQNNKWDEGTVDGAISAPDAVFFRTFPPFHIERIKPPSVFCKRKSAVLPGKGNL